MARAMLGVTGIWLGVRGPAAVTGGFPGALGRDSQLAGGGRERVEGEVRDFSWVRSGNDAVTSAHSPCGQNSGTGPCTPRPAVHRPRSLSSLI